MKRAAVLVPLAITLAMPFDALAATKVMEKVKIIGETAVATWNYTQDNKTTYVNVVVTNNNVTFNGVKSEDAFAVISIAQSDATTGDVLVSGTAVATDFTFTIDTALNGAALSIPQVTFVDDANATNFDLAVNLTWTGSGAITSQHIKDNFQEPGFKMKSEFKGDFREATASGSVSGNSTQFTSVAAESAQLEHGVSGSMTVTTTF